MDFPGVTAVSRLRQFPEGEALSGEFGFLSRLGWRWLSHLRQRPTVSWRELAGGEVYALLADFPEVEPDHFLRQETYHSRPFFIGRGDDLVLSRHAKAVLAPGAGLIDELNVGGGDQIPEDLLAGDFRRAGRGWTIPDHEVERVAGDAVPFCHYGLEAFGHFVLDGLLQVFLFEGELRSGSARLVHWPFANEWMYSALAACEVPDQCLHEVSGPAVLLQTARLSSALAGHGVYFPCSVSLRFFDWLRLKLLGAQEIAGGRRIYLRRSDQYPRRMLNACAVEDLVTSHSFEIVSPEELSLQDQARLFASADVVMSPWGSSLTLAPLLGGSRRVVELLPTSITDPWFLRQAAVHNLAYTPILQRSQPNGDFEADLERIDRTLSVLD